jgi:hypothetical protein
VDAVLAGFFAEAGEHPDVLLSSMSALVFGAGAGERAFDGRVRQPGLHAERPRGVRAEEEVPPSAEVAAPRAVVTAVLMHAGRGRLDFAHLLRAGIEHAQNQGAQRRAAILDDIGKAKAVALGREPIVEALLASGGRAAGGGLSRADLAPLPIEGAGAIVSMGRARIVRVPWALDSAAEVHTPRLARGATEVIAVADTWGQIALLSYHRGPWVDVPGLQLALPRLGVPVLRGVPRITPGTAQGRRFRLRHHSRSSIDRRRLPSPLERHSPALRISVTCCSHPSATGRCSTAPCVS